MKSLATIEGCEITIQDDGSVTWTAKAAIDGDGSGGNSYHDPDFQADTSLHHLGLPLNAEIDRYIVVPPCIIQGVKGIVLGCQAFVFNTINGMETEAVVGDQGPADKLGEMSIACAKTIGIPFSPINGGEDNHVISYRIIPGCAGSANGVDYKLQPS